MPLHLFVVEQDYVQAHLAKHTTALGDPAAALNCYLQIVAAGRQSAERQNRFVKEFLELCLAHPDAVEQLICAQRGETELLTGLGIPRVNEVELQVYEAQNAAGGEYNACKVVGAKAWGKLVAQLECEAKSAASTLEEAAKDWVNGDEALVRTEATAKGLGRAAVQSVRVLGSTKACNPRARGEV